MVQHQRQTAELHRGSDDADDETGTVKDLLQEVLKDLRQIRGILGRIARETTAAHAEDGDR